MPPRARHRRCHEGLVAGLEAMGLTMAVPAAERVPELNAVRVPEGVDEAVAALVEDELKQAIVVPIKQERGAMIGAARERAVEALQDEFQVRQWLRIRCLARIGAISRAKPR